jgi:hypothetical protein
MKALEQWLIARTHLKEAVQAFHDACTTLQHDITQSLLAPDAQLHAENAMIRVSQEVTSIHSFEIKMAQSRALVHRLLNLSVKLAPINKLPPETLNRMFTFATLPYMCSSTRETSNPLVVIPSVCARWRQEERSI